MRLIDLDCGPPVLLFVVLFEGVEVRFLQPLRGFQCVRRWWTPSV